MLFITLVHSASHKLNERILMYVNKLLRTETNFYNFPPASHSSGGNFLTTLQIISNLTFVNQPNQKKDTYCAGHSYPPGFLFKYSW